MDELELPDISELKSLPLLASEDSNVDVEIKLWDT